MSKSTTYLYTIWDIESNETVATKVPLIDVKCALPGIGIASIINASSYGTVLNDKYMITKHTQNGELVPLKGMSSDFEKQWDRFRFKLNPRARR